MLTDLRLGFRTLARNPGFAFAAILSIGLAIGANAAIFSLADGFVLRPLPVPRASEVHTVSTRVERGHFTPFSGLSYPEYQDFSGGNRSFQSVAAFHPVTVGFAKDAQGQAQLRTSLAVSANFFEAMGVTPFHDFDAALAGALTRAVAPSGFPTEMASPCASLRRTSISFRL